MPYTDPTNHLEKAAKLHGNLRKNDSLTYTSTRPWRDHVIKCCREGKDCEQEKKDKAYVASIKGFRPYQEDRAGYFFLDLKFESLSDDQIKDALYDTFMQLGNDTKGHASGSTLVVSFQVGNRVFIANVGDSRAFFLVNDENQVNVIPLSWAHKPDVDSERQKIEEAKGVVEYFYGALRLNANLAISRAFGDKGVGPGLSYEPDISNIVLKDDTKEAYIALCSDGVTDKVETENIRDLFSDFLKSPKQENFSEALVSTAFTKGSGDNISAVVTDALKWKNEERIIVSFVADGHAGVATAEYIKENFSQALNKKLEDTLEEKLKKAPETNVLLILDRNVRLKGLTI